MTRARIDRSNGHKPVTLQTIATELGVSTATVSLALRDIPAVALETREAVREAAKRLGYVYNRSAASLRSATTGIIGVALHDLANPFLVEVLVAVEKAAALQSRSVVVTSNRVVQDWGKYLGDTTMAGTILDRLMHRSHLLEFEGKSYRLKEAAARIAQNPSVN